MSARSSLIAADPALAAVMSTMPDYDPHAAGAELPKTPFGVLLFQIVGQQISVPATRAILGRLLQLFGNEEPTPEQLLRMPEQLFVGVGLSKRKTGTAQRAAALFMDQGLSAEKLEQMTDDAINATLTSVTGIGTWTAQGFLVLALDRPDAFPAGDLAIRRAVQHLDRLDALPTEANVLQRAERWRPNRALAAGYLIAFDSKQEKDGSVGSGRTTPR